MTNEEKLEYIKSGTESLRAALDEIDRAHKAFEKVGVELITIPFHDKDMNVHVFTGLKKIETITGVRMRPTSDCLGRERNDEMSINYGGFKFHMLGKVKTKRSYSYD